MRNITEAAVTLGVTAVILVGVHAINQAPPTSYRPALPPRDQLAEAIARDRVKALPLLRRKLKAGTPYERKHVIWLFRENRLFELFPDVIEALTDTTPTHFRGGVSADGGFVGSHAATALQLVARARGFDIEAANNRQAFTFYNDMARLLKTTGANTTVASSRTAREKACDRLRRDTARLRAVQANWRRWWRTASDPARIANGGFPAPVVLATRRCGPFNITLTGHTWTMAGTRPNFQIALTNLTLAPVPMESASGQRALWEEANPQLGLRNIRNEVIRATKVTACPVGEPPRPPEPPLQPGETRSAGTWFFGETIDTAGDYALVLSFQLPGTSPLESTAILFKVLPVTQATVERAIAAAYQPSDSSPNLALQALREKKWGIVRLELEDGKFHARVLHKKGYAAPPASTGQNAVEEQWYHIEPVNPPGPQLPDHPFRSGYELRLPNGLVAKNVNL